MEQVETYETVLEKFEALLSQERSEIVGLDRQEIEQRYMKTATQMLTEMAQFPVRRAVSGNALTEEEVEQVPEIFDTIAQKLSNVFSRSKERVHSELKGLLEELPVEDLREVAFLKAKNRLH